MDYQPPSGGCVLKPISRLFKGSEMSQPPSGGCVLKPPWRKALKRTVRPAAFGRLCVETQVTKHCNVVDTTSRLRAAVC